MPGVAEACVVGVPDELLGEAIEAFVVVAPGGDSAGALLRPLSPELALYKVPRRLHIGDGLPRGSSGKVQRSELVRSL